MSHSQNDKQIEKLKKQVARNEAKGNFDTAHHQMLTNLLNPDRGVTPRNAKANTEAKDGKQNL